jgi:long-chain acyl-CoA synthetase
MYRCSCSQAFLTLLVLSCLTLFFLPGSTGKPKGVVINHRQIVAACAAGDIALGIRQGEDVYLAYLPLAHIMELMAQFVMIAMGCTLCYADPKSLTATGSYPIGALEAYSPTLMIAVPKIWDTIKKGIMQKVSHGSAVAQFLVATAFQWRGFALRHGFDTPLFKALVFSKFQKVVGGKLRFAISGGGALNTDVQEFCRTAFGVALVQGYVCFMSDHNELFDLITFNTNLNRHVLLRAFQGLTETCAGITIQAEDDCRGGIAGVLIPTVEVKLESCPDIKDNAGQPYLSADRHDVDGNLVFGRGEICVRGNNIATGYYMMEKQTKEEFRDDGWFHTGDIGQFMSDGSLRIVDRKKNLVKLKGGEYIALEKMEMTYGNSDFVDAIHGGICCYGDGDMDRPVALMQLNETTAMKWAKKHGVSGDFEKVKQSKELYEAVMADMKDQHAKGGLCHLEKLVGVALLTSPWTPENGCLTAANKLQRREVIGQFEKEFNEIKAKGTF